jgi:hypothetical protein
MSLTNISPNSGLLAIGANHPENEAAPSSIASILNALIAAFDGNGSVEVKLVDGAIVSTSGNVLITKVTGANLTLAAPTAGLPSAGGNDGQMLRVVATTTAATHVITIPATKLNGNKTTISMTTAGQGAHLMAYSGIWWTLANNGAVIA